jgi:hypothetical protein
LSRAAREEVHGLAMEFLIDVDDIDEEAVHHTFQEFEDRSAREPPRLGQRDEFRQHVAVRQPPRRGDHEPACLDVPRLGVIEVAQEARGVEEHHEGSWLSPYSRARSASICSLSVPVG